MGIHVNTYIIHVTITQWSDYSSTRAQDAGWASSYQNRFVLLLFMLLSFELCIC